MVDLPQHAGQVALWRDLLSSSSPWSELMRINLFTPYLAGYGVALPLAFLMPAGTAIKVVLTCALLGFVAACVALRKECRGDPRLDWLLITPFFGFAWQFGFVTFLVVAPLVIVFVRFSLRHARACSIETSAILIGLGLLMLLSHGLAFVFACAVGVALATAHASSVRGLASTAVPYVMLGIAFVGFFAASKGFDAPPASGVAGLSYSVGFASRIAVLFAFNHGFTGEMAMMSMLLLLAPFAIGAVKDWRMAVPAAVLLLVILAVPHSVMGTSYLFQRFDLFLLPLFIMMFAARPTAERNSDVREHFAVAAMVLACWAGLALMGHRLIAFGREAGEFDAVLAAAEPGKRALAISVDASSVAVDHPVVYSHFATWYQAEKKGLVDFNFANFHPQVVRYRPEHMPPAGIEFDRASHNVDWKKHRARDYDYYFVRHGRWPIPPQLIANGECRIETVAVSGAWTLLARGACQD